MAERLRFQTAANIKMGPFVDREDGASPETGLSISLSNVQVSKNGGAFAQKHQSSTPTHDVDGWYLVALDTGDTDTLGRLTVKIHDSGALPVWRHFEIVPQPVYDAEVLGTGNLQVETVAFSDTGVNNRLSRIQAEVDTGIRAHVSDVDTGIHDTIADLDTGLRAHITASAGGTPPDTGAIASAVWSKDVRTVTNVTGFSDTGVNDRLARILADTDTGLKDEIATLDTGLRDLIVDNAGNLLRIRGDTGAADRLFKLAGSQLKDDGTFDTGTGQTTNTFNVQANVTLDTGTPVNVQVDTGLLVASVWNYTSRTLTDFEDTGVFDEFSKLSTQISNADTGIRAAISQVSGGGTASADTGAIADAVWAKDTRTLTDYHDTGIDQSLTAIQSAVGDLDTGLRSAIQSAAYSDTGPSAALTRIESKLSEVDTGLRDALADLDTGLRDYITDAVPTANITAIKSQTDKLTFDTGNEILADIRKVNNVTVTGTGDTGAGDTWRPA